MEKISLSSIAEALAAKGGITREAASNFMHAFIKTIEKGLQENGMVKVKGLVPIIGSTPKVGATLGRALVPVIPIMPAFSAIVDQ